MAIILAIETSCDDTSVAIFRKIYDIYKRLFFYRLSTKIIMLFRKVLDIGKAILVYEFQTKLPLSHSYPIS